MELKHYSKYKDSDIEWIADIPEDWIINKLKFLTLKKAQYGANNEPEYNESKFDYRYIRITDVNEKGGLRADSLVYLSKENARGYVLNKGDILFARSGATVGKVYHHSKDDENCCFAGYMIRYVSDNSVLNPKFLLYYSLSLSYKDWIKITSNQSTIENVSAEKYDNLPIPTPKIKQQKEIVDYLDEKTLEIDKTIKKDRKLIELLKEKRNAIINKSVTKGIYLDTNMKDSGIEWIGKIPKNWKVVPLTKFLESKVDYRGKTPEKVVDGIFLVTGKNIKDGKIDYDKSQEYVRKEQYGAIMRRGKPKKGDLLFTTEAPLGEVANIDYNKIALAQRIIKMRGKEGVLDNYYLKYYMMSSTFQGHLQRLATGSTALGIKASKLFILRLILPPYDEQLEIVNKLNEIYNKSNITIQKIEKKIRLLEEYKKSLINNVVTGKVDVRGDDSLNQIHQKKDSKQTLLTI
ncbi:restriction endonuclease subunit S [Methanobacterium sp. ACI-7]|uniref:restriction endonuclease subunit S n=1 Tax=unclassified Methanobacterium TaxID=2627676 RepID=UPI0039C392F1